MKKFFIVAFVFFMCFSVFAGGESEAAETLVVWSTPIRAEIEDSFDDVIENFESTHPGVTVEFEEVNWSGVTEKLEIALRTDTTPDIFIDGTARTAKLPKTGLVVPVNDIIEGYDGWNENSLKIGQIDDVNYLLPLTLMPPSVMSVNVTLAKELGIYDMLPADHESWSAQEFYDFVKAGTVNGKDKDIYGIALYAANQSSDINVFSYIFSQGGRLLNDDKTECIINSPESIAALDVLKRLNDENLVYPGVITLKDDDVVPLSLSGNVLINFCITGSDLTSLNAASRADGTFDKEFIFESYAYPTVDGTDHMVSGSWGANCLAIFGNDGSNVELAKDFTRILLDDYEWFNDFYQMQPTYNPSRGEYELITDNKNLKDDVTRLGNFSKYAVSDFGILEDYWGEIRQQFYPKMQAIYSGDMSVEEALDSFKTSVDKILQKYNK